MKTILSFCLLVLGVMACRHKDVSPEEYIKPLYLWAEPTPNGLSLRWGPVFFLEEGMYPGPVPVAPAQYEIYISQTSGSGWQKVATVDGSIQTYILANQTAGQTLYAQIKAIHPSLTGNQSPVVTTHVGSLGQANLLFPASTSASMFGSWSDSTLLYSSSANTWVLQLADGSARTLKQEAYSAVLSPDGQSIAYRSSVNTNTSYATQLFIKRLDTGTSRLLETKQAIYTLEWSRDSQSIAFIASSSGSNGGTGVWVRNLSEAASVPVYIPPVGPDQLQRDQLDWSPDGQSVVVSQEMSQPEQTGSQLLKLPITGNAPQILLTSAWSDNYPTYSPDGRWLAFISPRSGYQAIWIYDLQMGELRQLTGSTEQFVYNNRLDWKNNRQLIYTHQSPATGLISLKIVTLPN